MFDHLQKIFSQHFIRLTFQYSFYFFFHRCVGRVPDKPNFRPLEPIYRMDSIDLNKPKPRPVLLEPPTTSEESSDSSSEKENSSDSSTEKNENSSGPSNSESVQLRRTESQPPNMSPVQTKAEKHVTIAAVAKPLTPGLYFMGDYINHRFSGVGKLFIEAHLLPECSKFGHVMIPRVALSHMLSRRLPLSRHPLSSQVKEPISKIRSVSKIRSSLCRVASSGRRFTTNDPGMPFFKMTKEPTDRRTIVQQLSKKESDLSWASFSVDPPSPNLPEHILIYSGQWRQGLRWGRGSSLFCDRVRHRNI